jgi:hypothetical protein
MVERATGEKASNGGESRTTATIRDIRERLDEHEKQDLIRFLALEKIMDERDRRYDERSKAQDRAVAVALESAEKATTKAETGQHELNQTNNEFRKSLDDAQKNTLNGQKDMMSRVEASAEFARISERNDDTKRSIEVAREYLTREIASLREWKSEHRGYSAGVVAAWAVIAGAIGLVGMGAGMFLHK